MSFTRTQLLSGSAAALAVSLGAAPALAQATPLKVAAGQIATQGQAYFALDQGFFLKRGLNASVGTFRGGAANAAAVAGGDMQFGVSSVLQLAQARGHGIPFVIVAPGGIHDSHVHIAALMVPLASPIVSPKDLNGKIIGVSSLNGLDELQVRALVDKSGGDPSSLKFTEIPPPAQFAALVQGRVDAVNTEDPERQLAIDTGKVRVLGDAEDAIAPVFAETAWFTTTDWLNANKDVTRRFVQAIYDSAAWAMQNPAKAADVMAKYLKSTPSPTPQRYALRTQLSDFQAILDVAAKYNFAPAMAASSLVWNGA